MAATGSTEAHYVHVVPNSHRWHCLGSLIRTIEFDVEYQKPENKKARKKREKEEKKAGTIVIDCYKPLTMEYLLTGLKNAHDDGYRLVKVKPKKKKKKHGKTRSL